MTTKPLLAVLAIVAALAAGCSGGSDSGPAEVGEPATVTASSTSTTTTTTAPPTTSVAAPTGAATPADAAQGLYDAWKANDRAAAATLATPEAVAGVFAAEPGDYALYNRCDTGEFGTSGCLFRSPATYATIQFNMESRDGRWVVIDAVYMPR